MEATCQGILQHKPPRFVMPEIKGTNFNSEKQKGVGEGSCGDETQGTLGGGEWRQES